jgi:hypothetical protein
MHEKQIYAGKTEAQTERQLAEGVQANRRRCYLFGILLRLQRRPLKRQHKFDELRTVTKVRELKISEIAQLVSMGQLILDEATRSIMMRNLRMILQDMDHVALIGITVRSPLMGVKGVQKGVLDEVERWCRAWRTRGLLVLVNVRATTAAAPSMLSRLNTTQRWAECDRAQAP